MSTPGSKASFEGQGPMLLEAMCHGNSTPVELPLSKDNNDLLIADWEPLLDILMNELRPVADRASIFHTSMAETILQQARQARTAHGVSKIGLSGGVFQNRALTEQAVALLENDDFKVMLPEAVPVNDAGISFGQVIEYGMRNE